MMLASLFSNGMVVQQGVSWPVWGWTRPGDELTAAYAPGTGSGDRRQSVTVRADAKGAWRAHLAPLRACAAPGCLTIRSAASGETRQVENVAVGEVWLASGQSNMQWPLRDSANGLAETMAARDPELRLFSVPQSVGEKAPRDVAAVWRPCSPETAADFSAVAYYFGREIRQTEKTPVGLVHSSWGGTRVESWTRRSALMEDPACRADVLGFETVLRNLRQRPRPREQEEFERDPNEWLRRHVAPDPGNEGLPRGWAEPDHDDTSWPVMDVPRPWQQGGVAGNGVVWFRRVASVPAAWAGRTLTLRLGACDKHETTYFNGALVGATGWETNEPWSVRRVYRIPGSLVRAGGNLVAVRVYSYRNQGGLTGPADEMSLAPADGASVAPLPLAGAWRFAVEQDFGVIKGTPGQPEPIPSQHSPYVLFDHMIRPLIPCAMRGAIWYQGESNVENAFEYRTRFPRMIRDWRRAWQSEFPFLFVQLANHLAPVQSPGASAWAELREAQALALREPRTGMAVAIDVGDALDIHPRDKKTVGQRLALAALAGVYGRAVTGSGPTYRSHTMEKDAIRIVFDHADGGLKTADGHPPRGFALAGSDRLFAWAEAKIENDTVRVRAREIPAPVAVRYGWADNPCCTLGNGAGLPAAPFRTDAWPGLTDPPGFVLQGDPNDARHETTDQPRSRR